MPDPVLVDFFKAQVVAMGPSGLSDPSDRYINSFCFRNDGLAAVVHDNITTRLQQFYDGLEQFLWPWANPRVEVRIYDLGKVPPRTPEVRVLDFSGHPLEAAQLPYEVAAVISTVAPDAPRTQGGLSESGARLVSRRRTGRLYIGPLRGPVLDFRSNGSPSFTPAFVNVLRTQAAGLATESASNPVRWHLLSQERGAAYRITGGWVDDEPDIVRRRGRDRPLSRTTWGSGA